MMTVYKILEKQKNENANATAYYVSGRHGDISLTYGELYDRVVASAAYYQQHESLRVGILGVNSINWVINVLGAIVAGNKTVALLDSQMPIDDLEAIIRRCELDYLICDSDLSDTATDICGRNGRLKFAEMLTDGTEDSFTEINRNSEMLFFTSGTTENSKIVVTPVEAIIGNVTEQVNLLGIEGDNKALIPIPFNHSLGFAKNIQSLVAGNTICISTMVRVLKDIKSVNPDILYIVPSGAEFLVKKNAIVSSLKHVVMAGSYLAPELADKIYECGVIPHNEYGSSEIPGGLGISLEGNHVDRITTTPVVSVELTGEGELYVTTNNHFKEYYKDPVSTLETISGNTVHTGDFAEITPDGKLHVLGRRKNMIVMENGEKLLYTDVDERIKAIRGVADGAVVYIDHKIVAAITLEAGANYDEVVRNIDDYNNTLPIYRRIRDIYEFKNGLPYTSSGKLLRRQIEEDIVRMML